MDDPEERPGHGVGRIVLEWVAVIVAVCSSRSS